MENKTDRKDKTAAYKQTRPDAGVFRIVNAANDRFLLGASTNLRSVQNRVDFAKISGTPNALPGKLAYEPAEVLGAISFEVLEVLKTKPEMTDFQIDQELKLLEEIWRERLGTENAY